MAEVVRLELRDLARTNGCGLAHTYFFREPVGRFEGSVSFASN